MVSERASPACTVTFSRLHDPSLTDASHGTAITGMFNAHQGLLSVGLTSLTRDEVPREGCRYAEEVPSGVQAGRRGGCPSR